MAKYSLAQSEQIFKSLQQSLQEICNQHELIYDSLTKLQKDHQSALVNMSQAWSKVLNLLVKVEHFRSTYSSFEQYKQ